MPTSIIYKQAFFNINSLKILGGKQKQKLLMLCNTLNSIKSETRAKKDKQANKWACC